jgi:hypothetical protein
MVALMRSKPSLFTLQNFLVYELLLLLALSRILGTLQRWHLLTGDGVTP